MIGSVVPRRRVLVLVIATMLAAVAARPSGQATTTPDLIAVDVSRPGTMVSPGMFGLFFEDINFAADGGLYPERVKNRSFEFDEPLSGWQKMARPFTGPGELAIRTDDPLHATNPHYLRMRGFRDGAFGVTNGGFRGIGIEAGAGYRVSAYVRVPSPGVTGLVFRITGAKREVLGEATLSGFTDRWARYEATITAAGTDAHAQLEVVAQGTGDVDLDVVSVFPLDTWKHRANGLRRDLVQLLADMKPGFLRFPGGCIVEGRRLALRYDWKKTLGDVDQREGLISRWNNEFSHRPAPDYYQSFGLGFYEYFQLAEDIGAAPLPIVNCGMACQFNSAELAPLDALDPFIQDALDLIEFANGAVTTRWGALRAQLGHPASFGMKAIGIGNEQWGPAYVERFERFARALKAAHPEIALVAASGPAAAGEAFDYLWTNLRRLRADLVDEHYYMSTDWFLANATRYDHYDRTGPRVFAGEYAAQTTGQARPDNRNSWKAALAEAAFMTGLERNTDVVAMASYAPLFAHVDAWQWTPNLIWFDNLRAFGTPNYYVQKLYGTNQGTHTAQVTVNGSAANAEHGLYTSAQVDRAHAEVILKVVNATAVARPVRVRIDGATGTLTEGRMVVLAGDGLEAENDLDHPTRVAPVEKTLAPSAGGFDLTLAPQSFTVVRARLAP